jgi:protein gp37
MFGRHLWKCPACVGTGIGHAPGPYRCQTCGGTGYQDFTPTFHPDRLDVPLHWRKPRRIGVCFLGDLFHEAITDEQRDAVMVRMAATRDRHTFLLLTKRPDEMHRYMTRWVYGDQGWGGTYERFWAAVEAKTDVRTWDWLRQREQDAPLPNVHLGVTVCTDAERPKIDLLRQTPAAVRWLSLEPLLGPVDMSALTDGPKELHRIDWVVLGGETGPGARPMEPEWALDVYRQCKAARVPFFWKQWGTAHVPNLYPGMSLPDREACHEMVGTREYPAVRP